MQALGMPAQQHMRLRAHVQTKRRSRAPESARTVIQKRQHALKQLVTARMLLSTPVQLGLYHVYPQQMCTADRLELGPEKCVNSTKAAQMVGERQHDAHSHTNSRDYAWRWHMHCADSPG